MEIWKDIIGFENKYQVSNIGNVKSLNYLRSGKEKILKNNLGSTGYLAVVLCKNGIKKPIRVHQLVAIAFHNHKLNGYKLVINHKDFNKLNNNENNLEIVTQRENANKKHIDSSSNYVGVYWNKQNKKWNSSIMINGKIKFLGSFALEIEANNAYKIELTKI